MKYTNVLGGYCLAFQFKNPMLFIILNDVPKWDFAISSVCFSCSVSELI